jgi:hypothetical protein
LTMMQVCGRLQYIGFVNWKTMCNKVTDLTVARSPAIFRISDL